ncbi:VOC family protein [Kitasatospora sp. NPDC058190]|uniref:VOC family protein n=1 Tax=Kitasatospora sp. NPDC058190 TaxID=3346371 RepID=UPI0036DDCA7A
MDTELDELEVITLFVADVPAAKAFYREVFGLPVVYEDDASAVVRLRNLLVNLLAAEQAPELVTPAPVAAPATGVRALLTVRVPDVDAVCAQLAELGVALLNGPVDRPWGRWTAAFADPAGHVWEVAQDLARAVRTGAPGHGPPEDATAGTTVVRAPSPLPSTRPAGTHPRPGHSDVPRVGPAQLRPDPAQARTS